MGIDPRKPLKQSPVPAGIELLVLDVDGVMTDGGIYIDSAGCETKRFNVTDGAGVKFWQRAGKSVAILSGRSNPAVLQRAGELGVTIVKQGFKDKLPAYLEILADLKLRPEQSAVMGDDLMDLPLMRRCGFAVAPANAVAEILAAAHRVTARTGGNGAVREAVEILLKGLGLWAAIAARYDK